MTADYVLLMLNADLDPGLEAGQVGISVSWAVLAIMSPWFAGSERTHIDVM